MTNGRKKQQQSLDNRLYYGDNLEVLQKYISDESIDLIYLDPPFNSKRPYNILFASNGAKSSAQIQAFDDTWQWGDESERAYSLVMKNGGKSANLLDAFRKALGENDVMAYLAMMAVRFIELHRVLKNTGSMYLHCDPTASHYLKLLLDSIFGPTRFRNEIVWCYKSRPQSKKYFGRKHDVILFYTKTDEYKFDWRNATRPLTDAAVAKYRHSDEKGRRFRLEGRGITGSPVRSQKDVPLELEKSQPELVVRDYLDEKIGVVLEDWWIDINIVNQAASERLPYPTQKPVALLERIISASSSEGDIVLDPFCGCGTALYAAQKLNRNWIGIDITHIAIGLIERRLKDAFRTTLKIFGLPEDLNGAKDLFSRDPWQFEAWAVTRIPGIIPNERKGADRGVDGFGWIQTEKGKYAKILVQVKGGSHKGSAMIRDFKGTLQREKADAGIFVVMESYTKEMKKEAASAGRFTGKEGLFKFDIPKIQIFTIGEYFEGKLPALPTTMRYSE
ncbi:MAG: DNA methyltransferase [bacterium]|nr:DNA methyltransferase [bacterium]